MTESGDALEAISRAASDLVPELSERLARHRLGEIEVAHGGLRLRLRVAAAATPLPALPDAARAGEPDAEHADVSPQPSVETALGVASPAVGFFVYADGLGRGLAVTKGDALGHVEMLGVRHDVRAPRGGTVRNLVAESGEAVEYGQVVIELEAVESVR